MPSGLLRSLAWVLFFRKLLSKEMPLLWSVHLSKGKLKTKGETRGLRGLKPAPWPGQSYEKS